MLLIDRIVIFTMLVATGTALVVDCYEEYKERKEQKGARNGLRL